MLIAHLQEPPKPLTEHRPDIPGELQEIVLRCLAKAPGERFPDAASLDQALTGCAAALPWSEAEAAAWWRLGAEAGGRGDTEIPGALQAQTLTASPGT
jgi:serine/threonine-protein kinase